MLKTAGYRPTSNCFTINKVRRQSLEFIFTERAKNDELLRLDRLVICHNDVGY